MKASLILHVVVHEAFGLSVKVEEIKSGAIFTFKLSRNDQSLLKINQKYYLSILNYEEHKRVYLRDDIEEIEEDNYVYITDLKTHRYNSINAIVARARDPIKTRGTDYMFTLDLYDITGTTECKVFYLSQCDYLYFKDLLIDLPRILKFNNIKVPKKDVYSQFSLIHKYSDIKDVTKLTLRDKFNIQEHSHLYKNVKSNDTVNENKPEFDNFYIGCNNSTVVYDHKKKIEKSENDLIVEKYQNNHFTGIKNITNIDIIGVLLYINIDCDSFITILQSNMNFYIKASSMKIVEIADFCKINELYCFTDLIKHSDYLYEFKDESEIKKFNRGYLCDNSGKKSQDYIEDVTSELFENKVSQMDSSAFTVDNLCTCYIKNIIYKGKYLIECKIEEAQIVVHQEKDFLQLTVKGKNCFAEKERGCASFNILVGPNLKKALENYDYILNGNVEKNKSMKCIIEKKEKIYMVSLMIEEDKNHLIIK
ncbi:hypothetical protein NUSPORA_01942 [Nucleospora cyclopteri]